jgi:hypothetical protein
MPDYSTDYYNPIYLLLASTDAHRYICACQLHETTEWCIKQECILTEWVLLQPNGVVCVASNI